MKKISKILLIIMVLVSTFTITNVRADDYFYGDDNVVISNPANHNIFGAGENVTLNEKVNGISFLGGLIVNINKESEYVFAAGNQINVNTNVTKDLFLAGNNISIKGDVGRDAYIAGNNIRVDGKIDGNLFIGGSIIDLSNTVIQGNVNTASATLILNENTEIVGKLTYDEDTYVSGLDKAKVGETEVQKVDVEVIDKEEVFKTKVINTVTNLFTTLASLVILFGVFPKLYKHITKKREASEYAGLGLRGAGILIALPIALIFALFLVVTIPLVFVCFALYGVSIYIGELLGIILLGQLILTKLFKAKDNKYLSMLIGSVLYVLIGLVPVCGGLFTLVINVIGIGLVLELFKKLHDYAK